jgi:hypothetical protein
MLAAQYASATPTERLDWQQFYLDAGSDAVTMAFLVGVPANRPVRGDVVVGVRMWPTGTNYNGVPTWNSFDLAQALPQSDQSRIGGVVKAPAGRYDVIVTLTTTRDEPIVLRHTTDVPSPEPGFHLSSVLTAYSTTDRRQGWLQIMPGFFITSPRTEFPARSKEEVAFFLRVLNAGDRERRALRVRLNWDIFTVSPDGAERFFNRPQPTERALQDFPTYTDAFTGFTDAIAIPLSAFPPAQYRLRVTAEDLVTGAKFARTQDFQVGRS